jgi:hypothetical protein
MKDLGPISWECPPQHDFEARAKDVPPGPSPVPRFVEGFGSFPDLRDRSPIRHCHGVGWISLVPLPPNGERTFLRRRWISSSSRKSSILEGAGHVVRPGARSVNGGGALHPFQATAAKAPLPAIGNRCTADRIRWVATQPARRASAPRHRSWWPSRRGRREDALGCCRLVPGSPPSASRTAGRVGGSQAAGNRPRVDLHESRVTSVEKKAENPTRALPVSEATGRGRPRLRVGVARFDRLRLSGKVSGLEATKRGTHFGRPHRQAAAGRSRNCRLRARLMFPSKSLRCRRTDALRRLRRHWGFRAACMIVPRSVAAIPVSPQPRSALFPPSPFRASRWARTPIPSPSLRSASPRFSAQLAPASAPAVACSILAIGLSPISPKVPSRRGVAPYPTPAKCPEKIDGLVGNDAMTHRVPSELRGICVHPSRLQVGAKPLDERAMIRV